jgi:hypothetical protein
MTLEIRDAIRRRDRIRTGTVAFRSAKRQVADILRSASARFVVPVPSVQIPTTLEHTGGFSFRHIDLAECFSVF